ncbi:hydroxyacylglutathione hydrolase [Hydrogenophaga sp. 5NK40-0174]|uniref:hydroxyacylglutathione hydrolase n=1 Tax=Hydrogenophaga sp. 5NK40-0174 TaxID=3127649 RepID=UPI0031056BA2
MTLHPVPAFNDNYIWVLHDASHALVVDPGETAGVISYLKEHKLTLEAVLITHHHGDHTGGVAELREAMGCQVFGPALEKMPEPLTRVQGGQRIGLLGLEFKVMDVPGHTAGHIAYFCDQLDSGPLVFCGDTLFSGGCGRLFEETPQQMHASLAALSSLPAETRVCCAHEYTLANLAFAEAVEPGNADLQAYIAQCKSKRSQGIPTVPSTIDTERHINPFLRASQAEVIQSAQKHAPATSADEISVWTALREWKNQF